MLQSEKYSHSSTSIKAASVPILLFPFNWVWHHNRRLFCMAQSSCTRLDLESALVLTGLSDVKLLIHWKDKIIFINCNISILLVVHVLLITSWYATESSVVITEITGVQSNPVWKQKKVVENNINLMNTSINNTVNSCYCIIPQVIHQANLTIHLHPCC